MAQVFHPSTNTIARVTIFGGIFLLGGLVWVLAGINSSDYVTKVQVVQPQPVPFSHKHHVSGLGIDCRYCHTTVETSNFAGIPPTETCMSCHSQIWVDSPMLEPVRASLRDNKSLEWTRVNDVPDFVYFNHSIHINKGIGCETCHGRVDQMPLMVKAETLQMEWCLTCHRDPGQYIRPREQVFTMGYSYPANQKEVGQRLVKEYNVRSLIDCYTCHR
ncbi:MAG: cytochrome c3 family protein [Bryobacteraceae bacterium]|nr:cytochrome c family protein [Bryobacterales bacterium]MEB2363132.1 cytochrome c3 family protein [Bryobacterales bacterium]NUN03997.1 cytochrome c3 family protein [Bryobacteraceae bacterium]RIK27064.1 MAG: cytochrome C [Chloroflexota bacterium]